MADSKLEIKVGSISFSGEGDSDWLSKQLDKLLTKIPELLAVVPQANGEYGDGNGSAGNGASGATIEKATGTLAAFLKASNANGSQPRKFLAAAIWLHDSEQKNRLTTADVTATLSKHNQGKLSNASDCLIKNAAKGYCVREGKQFYVANEGRDSLK